MMAHFHHFKNSLEVSLYWLFICHQNTSQIQRTIGKGNRETRTVFLFEFDWQAYLVPCSGFCLFAFSSGSNKWLKLSKCWRNGNTFWTHLLVLRRWPVGNAARSGEVSCFMTPVRPKERVAVIGKARLALPLSRDLTWVVDGRSWERQFNVICKLLLIAGVLNPWQELRVLDGVWKNMWKVGRVPCWELRSGFYDLFVSIVKAKVTVLL